MFRFQVGRVKKTHCCRECNKVLKTNSFRVYSQYHHKNFCLKCAYHKAKDLLEVINKDKKELKEFLASYPFGIAVAEEL